MRWPQQPMRSSSEISVQRERSMWQRSLDASSIEGTVLGGIVLSESGLDKAAAVRMQLGIGVCCVSVTTQPG